MTGFPGAGTGAASCPQGSACHGTAGLSSWGGQPVDGHHCRRLGIAGGTVYDALVALAAKEHGAALATRDARARGTYDAVGVELIVVT